MTGWVGFFAGAPLWASIGALIVGGLCRCVDHVDDVDNDALTRAREKAVANDAYRLGREDGRSDRDDELHEHAESRGPVDVEPWRERRLLPMHHHHYHTHRRA